MVTATDDTFHSGFAGLRPQVDRNVTLQFSDTLLGLKPNSFCR